MRVSAVPIRIALLPAVLATASGCCFPIPHIDQSYEAARPSPSTRAPEYSDELAPWFVGASFVEARLFAEDPDEDGEGVFSLHVGIADGSTDEVTKATLAGFEMWIDDERQSGFSLYNRTRRETRVVPFKDPLDFRDAESGHIFFFSDNIEPADPKFREVRIIMDLVVESGDRVTSKEVTYSFRRKLRRRYVMCTEV